MMDWTGQQGQKAAHLWNEGKSASEIAKVFGVSRGAVTGGVSRLKAMGLITRSDAPRNDWSAQEIARLRPLIDDGNSLHRIAEILGKSYDSVKARVGRMVAIGKLDRKPRSLNIGANPSAFTKRRSEERVAQNTVSGQSLLKRIDSAMTGEGVPLLEIRAFRCRFITGGAPEWRMCGEPVDTGSWCQKCRSIVYARAA